MRREATVCTLKIFYAAVNRRGIRRNVYTLFSQIKGRVFVVLLQASSSEPIHLNTILNHLNMVHSSYNYV